MDTISMLLMYIIGFISSMMFILLIVIIKEFIIEYESDKKIKKHKPEGDK